MYTNKYTVISLPGTFPEQCVRIWNAWTEVAGPTSVERQDERDLIIQPDSTGPTERIFVSNADLTIAVPPLFVALSIQDNFLAGRDEGWIFRSGRYTPELPAEPIECILANDVHFNQTDLDAMLPALPFIDHTTTITAISAMISGTSLALDITGTDSSSLPSGETFRYTATMNLLPNPSVTDTDEPLEIGMLSPAITFSGIGFPGFLNIIHGIIIRDFNPLIKTKFKEKLNASILASVAALLSRGTTTTLPAGVIVSIRRIRFVVNSNNIPEVIISAAICAFGGVVSKLPPPPPTTDTGKPCFIATAALGPNAPELEFLRRYRDFHLLKYRTGRIFIAVYESVSPPIAAFIARSVVLRKITRKIIIAPLVFIVSKLKTNKQ